MNSNHKRENQRKRQVERGRSKLDEVNINNRNRNILEYKCQDKNELELDGLQLNSHYPRHLNNCLSVMENLNNDYQGNLFNKDGMETGNEYNIKIKDNSLNNPAVSNNSDYTSKDATQAESDGVVFKTNLLMEPQFSGRTESYSLKSSIFETFFENGFFSDSLEVSQIDSIKFRKICFTGIPEINKAVAYKVLLGVYNKFPKEFEEIDKIKYEKYLNNLEGKDIPKNHLFKQTRTIFPDTPKVTNSNNIVNSDSEKADMNMAKKSILPELTVLNRSIVNMAEPDSLEDNCSGGFTTKAQSSDTFFYATDLFCRFNLCQKLVHQIYIDILRIDPKHRVYRNVDVSYIYENVLRISAYKRPYLGYVQGMADLVVPFVQIFVMGEIDRKINSGPRYGINWLDHELIKGELLFAESQTFQCFDHLISKLEFNIHDMQITLINKLGQVLEIVDTELYNHFKYVELDLQMVVFRWFNCLFIREFDLNSWFRIFDSMLSTDIGEFLVYYSAAILIHFRKHIFSKDFSEICLMLQNISEVNAFDLLGSAVFIMGEYEEYTSKGNY